MGRRVVWRPAYRLLAQDRWLLGGLATFSEVGDPFGRRLRMPNSSCSPKESVLNL